MKGKKYTAAEKHFAKLQERYQREIRLLHAHNVSLKEQIDCLQRENSILSSQVDIYKDMLGVDADKAEKQQEQNQKMVALLGRLILPLI